MLIAIIMRCITIHIILLSIFTFNNVARSNSYKRPKIIEEHLKKRFECKAALDNYNDPHCPYIPSGLQNPGNYNVNPEMFSRSQNTSTVFLILQSHKTNDIFENVSSDTISLHVILKTQFTGEYLINEKDVLNLTNGNKLHKLQKLIISQCSQPFYQPFKLWFNRDTFASMKNLRYFQLNVDLDEICVDDMHNCNDHDVQIKPPVSLQVLDLSMTKGMSAALFQQLTKYLNIQDVERICLIHFQSEGTGTPGYNSVFNASEFFEGQQFSNLESFDISSNDVIQLDAGITEVMPSLQTYSVSNNMLMNFNSFGALVELLLFKPLQYVDASFQHTTVPGDIKKKVESHFEAIWMKLALCINGYSGGNVSQIIHNSSMTRNMLLCTFPRQFHGVPSSLFPPMSEIMAVQCLFFTKIPMNKKEVYIDSIRWKYHIDYSHNNTKKACFEENNMTVISAANNAIISVVVGQFMNQLNRFMSLDTLNIENNDFAWKMNNINNIPREKRNFKYFYAANNKLSVEKDFQFCKLMPEVEVLDVSGNPIASDGIIPVKLVKNCSKLRNLKLADTNVSCLNSLDLSGTEQLNFLNLSNNNLKDITGFLKQIGMVYKNKGIKIDLTGNPFDCGCSSINNIKTLGTTCTSSNITLINLQQIACYGPAGITNLSQLIHSDIYFAEQINKCPHIGFLIGVGSAFGTIGSFTVVLLVIIFCKKKWHIKYAFFKMKQYFKSRSSKDGRHSWRYDAFISYCAEDRFWVHDVLTKTLEKQYQFRLCIHYRDFPLGGAIADTIVECMEDSREFILVVTDNFFKSQWCLYEMNQALVMADRRKSRIVLLKLGDITEENLREARILDTHTYLEWKDEHDQARKLFWAKLIGILYGDDEGCSFFCPYGTRVLTYDRLSDAVV